MNICRICGNENNNEIYLLQEMMFGTRDEFEYHKCSSCGCLQINQYPENMWKYYPSDYLSFSEPNQSGLKKFLLKKRDNYALTGNGLLGKLLCKKFGYPDFYLWYSNAILNKNDFILDVGCGGGSYY